MVETKDPFADVLGSVRGRGFHSRLAPTLEQVIWMRSSDRHFDAPEVADLINNICSQGRPEDHEESVQILNEFGYDTMKKGWHKEYPNANRLIHLLALMFAQPPIKTWMRERVDVIGELTGFNMKRRWTEVDKMIRPLAYNYVCRQAHLSSLDITDINASNVLRNTDFFMHLAKSVHRKNHEAQRALGFTKTYRLTINQWERAIFRATIYGDGKDTLTIKAKLIHQIEKAHEQA